MKKLVSISVAVIMTALIFIGCSGEKEDSTVETITVTEQADQADLAKEEAVEETEGFSWELAKGASINVMLNQHPYAEAIIEKLPEFEALTGITVEHTVTLEADFDEEVSTALTGHSGNPDVFMTGPNRILEYAPQGLIQPLEGFIRDENLTGPDYNFSDFYKGVVDALRWDLMPGHMTGVGSQWALPMGFEQFVLAYNKRILEERGLTPPRTMEELYVLAKELNEFDGPGTYGLALRGTKDWVTINTGYLTVYTNYGAQDVAVEDGRLVSKVNSPEAVEMTEMWVDIIRDGGSTAWSECTWYQAGEDLGSGKAAMMLDADIIGYFQNLEDASKEAGNIAWVPVPLPEGKTDIHSNLWTWALAMNDASANKEAAWLFIQYFTSPEFQLWQAIDGKGINPARLSVFNDEQFDAIIVEAEGYRETFEATVLGTGIQFTPQPYFMELTTEWAGVLQDIVSGEYESVQQAMDELKMKMDEALKDIQVE